MKDEPTLMKLSQMICYSVNIVRSNFDKIYCLDLYKQIKEANTLA